MRREHKKEPKEKAMRNTKPLLAVAAAALAFSISPSFAAENVTKPAPAASARSCSANSADRLQSCSVTCPEGKTATCVGGAQGARDVDCTCK
jgi:hypothetical protein